MRDTKRRKVKKENIGVSLMSLSVRAASFPFGEKFDGCSPSSK